MRTPSRRLVVALCAQALLLGALVSARAVPPDLRKLKGDLTQALRTQDAAAMQRALEALIEAGGEEALEAVTGTLPRLGAGGSDEAYWQLVSAAAGFRDASALAALGRTIAKEKRAPWARDLLYALENNTSPEVTRALGPVLEDASYDLQLMAADQLGRIKTVASVDALIAALEREGDGGDPQVRHRVLTSLRSITGQDMGDRLNWVGWWKAQRQNGVPAAPGDAADGSGHLASQTMPANRQGDLTSLTRADPKRVLVISSLMPPDDPKQPNRDYDYDHMERVLDDMKIPHTVVLKKHFEADPDRYLRDAWTVLVNCNQIQTMCICPQCAKNLADAMRAGTAGGTNNRLYGCPPGCDVHDQVSHRMTAQTVQKLKAWVEQGGYLFTEDWGLVEVQQVAWPELISSRTLTTAGGAGAGGGKQETSSIRACDVTITPGRGSTSLPLMRGVFARPRPPVREDDGQGEGGTRVRDLGGDSPAAPPQHRWKIDDESPSIQVKDPRQVKVLIESDDLATQASGDGAVAVSFRVGNARPGTRTRGDDQPERPVTGGGTTGGLTGRSRARGEWAEELPGGCVLHVLSHFGKQQSRIEDTFVLQNLILNFVMESHRQHGG